MSGGAREARAAGCILAFSRAPAPPPAAPPAERPAGDEDDRIRIEPIAALSEA